MKTALITGITGQDGSYLAEFLLEKGYDVHGMIRRNSSDYRERIAHLEGVKNFHLHFGHLGDSMSIISIINKVKPGLSPMRYITWLHRATYRSASILPSSRLMLTQQVY